MDGDELDEVARAAMEPTTVEVNGVAMPLDGPEYMEWHRQHNRREVFEFDWTPPRSGWKPAPDPLDSMNRRQRRAVRRIQRIRRRLGGDWWEVEDYVSPDSW